MTSLSAEVLSEIGITLDDLQLILIPPCPAPHNEIIKQVDTLIHRLFTVYRTEEKTLLGLTRLAEKHYQIRENARTTPELTSELSVIRILIRACRSAEVTRDDMFLLTLLRNAQ